MTLRPGKLPSPLLATLLARITRTDPRVLVGPGIGRDAAVIDLGDGRVLVAKTDPVTFAAEHIGWYAVNVNANDIACMGARPAWMLATALLPPGGPDTLPGEVFDQITAACAALQIELVGGHTEVTMGLDRPIVIGAMLGEATIEEIVAGENVSPGDVVLLTKGIAIEGTALLARESGDALATAGVAPALMAQARNMLHEPGISVVPEARAICDVTRPRLMHDPTEGGLTTALYELAEAAGATLYFDPSAVRVFAETSAICEALHLDPMGLLASGALLAVVSEADCVTVEARLAEMKISCQRVAMIGSGPPVVIMGTKDSAPPLPTFARDELARFYDTAGSGDRR